MSSWVLEGQTVPSKNWIGIGKTTLGNSFTDEDFVYYLKAHLDQTGNINKWRVVKIEYGCIYLEIGVPTDHEPYHQRRFRLVSSQPTIPPRK
jgi:hypothetical protein